MFWFYLTYTCTSLHVHSNWIISSRCRKIELIINRYTVIPNYKILQAHSCSKSSITVISFDLFVLIWLCLCVCFLWTCCCESWFFWTNLPFSLITLCTILDSQHNEKKPIVALLYKTVRIVLGDVWVVYA